MDYQPPEYSVKKDKLEIVKEFILKYDKQLIGISVVLVLFIMYKIYTYFKGTELPAAESESETETAAIEAEKEAEEATSLAEDLALKLVAAEEAVEIAVAELLAAESEAEDLAETVTTLTAISESAALVAAEPEATQEQIDAAEIAAEEVEAAEAAAAVAETEVLAAEEAEAEATAEAEAVATESAEADSAATEAVADLAEVLGDSSCSTFELCVDDCPDAINFGYEACRHCCTEDEFCIVNSDSSWCTEETAEAEEEQTPEEICAEYTQADGCPADLGCRSATDCPPDSSDQHTCDYYVSLGDGPDGPLPDPTYEGVKSTMGCECACEPIPEVDSDLTTDEQAEIDYCNETTQADLGGCQAGCRPARDCLGDTCEDWVNDSEGTRDYDEMMGDRYSCACACEPTVEGCTNSSADNYDPYANSTNDDSDSICITCDDYSNQSDCDATNLCAWNGFYCVTCDEIPEDTCPVDDGICQLNGNLCEKKPLDCSTWNGDEFGCYGSIEGCVWDEPTDVCS